jgi:tetratricopeptide (TPR) repeat protein
MNVQSDKENEKIIIELTKEGYRLLKDNRPDEAEGRFKIALSHDPANAYALSGIGDAARKKGDFAAAHGFYSACLKAHPDNNYALFGLGDCYRGLNDLPRAIETWRACLEREGDNLSYLSSIADAYRKLSDLNHAKEYYTRALKINPGYVHALKGLGYLYFDLKMFREAILYWEDVLRRDAALADDAEVMSALGNCLRRASEFTKAKFYFERAVALEPEGFPGNFGLADCHRGLGDFDKARRSYDKILEREPRNQSILTRAGDMCVNLNDLETARKYFEKTLEIGDNIYARFGFVHIQKRLGDYREALRLLEDMDKRYPENQRIRYEIKECREKIQSMNGK